MEWIERLNRAIYYIEEHLTEEVDYEQIGKIVTVQTGLCIYCTDRMKT